MALEVMIVNGDRYVLNVDSKHIDRTADEIISQYPQEPTLDWDEVRDIDVQRAIPSDVMDLINKLNG